MMDPDSEAEPHFRQPVRQIAAMLAVLVLVGAGARLVWPQVAPVFLANPWLNGFIGVVFVIGVLACFWQVMQLVASARWLEGFANDRPGHELVRAPRLLAPLAQLLRARGARMQIGASSARSILDSVATRIDEARDITRYLVNLLIFLGLLGTFYGLATTVPAIVDTIRSLAPQDGEGASAAFARLMSGLEAQLGGMGIAFASSLLGLAGSLVVGLLELFASHGQNRFYRELEEWLSTITRLGFSSDGDHGDTAVVANVLDHMAEQMEALQTLYSNSDVSRALVDQRLGQLADAVERLAGKLDEGSGSDAALDRVWEGQNRISEGNERLIDGQERLIGGQERLIELMRVQVEGRSEHAEGPIDSESRMRLRSIDVQLLRILEELSAGRQETLAELRGDLAQLTKAIRLASRETSPAPPSPLAARRG